MAGGSQGALWAWRHAHQACVHAPGRHVRVRVTVIVCGRDERVIERLQAGEGAGYVILP